MGDCLNVVERGKPIRSELFQIVSVLFVFALTLFASVPGAAFAKNGDIQFYRIDVDVDENNKATVDMVITFKYPERRFSFDIIGRV